MADLTRLSMLLLSSRLQRSALQDATETIHQDVEDLGCREFDPERNVSSTKQARNQARHTALFAIVTLKIFIPSCGNESRHVCRPTRRRQSHPNYRLAVCSLRAEHACTAMQTDHGISCRPAQHLGPRTIHRIVSGISRRPRYAPSNCPLLKMWNSGMGGADGARRNSELTNGLARLSHRQTTEPV